MSMCSFLQRTTSLYPLIQNEAFELNIEAVESTLSQELLKRESSLAHLLRTNNVPSQKEVIELRSLRHDAETEFTRLQKLYPSPTHSLQTVERLIATCKGALSPLRRFPPELLLAIFSFTLSDLPSHYRLHEALLQSVGADSSPSVLTQVCGLWRSVALNGQGLWSRVFIDLELPEKNPVPPTTCLANLQQFLDRSGTHPLSIYFGDSYSTSDHATNILLLLMLHCRRWREVWFFISQEHLHLMEQVKGCVPILRSLYLSPFGANIYGVSSAFEESPELHEALLLAGNHDMSLPWSQLTKIGGNHISRDTLLQIPNLVELDFIWDLGTLYFPSETTRLPSLKALRVNCEKSLEWLEAPGLELIEVPKSRSLRSPTNLYTLSSLVRRSGCALRSLSLSEADVGGDAESLEELIAAIPSLLRLELEECDVEWGVLSEVVAPQGSRRRLPNIQDVVFVFGENDLPGRLEAATLDLLESLVTSREGFSSLRSASLLNVVISPEEQGRISRLEDAGLRVVHGWRSR
ncbi:hypothetical protein H0H81_000908 [Sphagnurus paluster]|uniref:F-box domain-containing protein n=1 Tax=Sphagnurus paluster TaxID=117069 RepID=A0A9P7FMV0_9AGAR|nr:hypothetical protein H0H81_000908 [Sphagnurus paluster]